MFLFLDIDGVLHPEHAARTHSSLCKLPLLERVLRKHSDLRIVISSTWRIRLTCEQIARMFSPDLTERVVGVTPRWADIAEADSSHYYVRQAEIEAWLKENGEPWDRWVALDDKPWLFRPFLKNLLTVNSNTGLTEELCRDLEDAIRKQSR